MVRWREEVNREVLVLVIIIRTCLVSHEFIAAAVRRQQNWN